MTAHDPHIARYWRGLSDDYLGMAATFIRSRQYGKAAEALSGALRNSNRARDMRRSGRAMVAIQRLRALAAQVPPAPVAWGTLVAAE